MSAFAGIALLGGPTGQTWVSEYGFISLQILIGLAMLISASTVLFTARVARRSIPPEYRTSPFFRTLNRRLSAAWAVAVLGGGMSRILWLVAEGASGQASMHVLGVFLNWVLPVGLICAAYLVTKRTKSRHLRIAASVRTAAAAVR